MRKVQVLIARTRLLNLYSHGVGSGWPGRGYRTAARCIEPRAVVNTRVRYGGPQFLQCWLRHGLPRNTSGLCTAVGAVACGTAAQATPAARVELLHEPGVIRACRACLSSLLKPRRSGVVALICAGRVAIRPGVCRFADSRRPAGGRSDAARRSLWQMRGLIRLRVPALGVADTRWRMSSIDSPAVTSRGPEDSLILRRMKAAREVFVLAAAYSNSSYGSVLIIRSE